MCVIPITGRWALNASHKIKINKSKAINEIIEPKDETTFHLV